jgi:(1->4)-alpha-D-glucan 1-alpha-D-glucosylmutase
VVACFPVYRTYITEEQITTEDKRFVDWAISVAKKRSQAADVSIFDFVRDVVLTMIAEGKTEDFRQMVIAFAMKFQQYTGPLMAKGLEDTGFYRYNRLVSLNEVGGDPRRFGISVSAFHHANQERVRRWPHAMLGTSTHDSKRSEDVRTRIDVLSELPDEWRGRLHRWSRLNERKKRLVDGESAPSRNDEYLLYQTLIGAWPLEELDEEGRRIFCERIENYMLKAVKEAKARSSWINPHAEYEEAVVTFVKALLEEPDKNRFLADFLPFQKQVSRFGLLNSLSQILLKFTSPGVPDIYQGTELWDFSLVDPDNRRPVDYDQRGRMLQALKDLTAVPAEEQPSRVHTLMDTMEDGRIKLYLTWKVLTLRKEHPELFEKGDYVPLTVTGARAEHVCAFARRYQDLETIIIAPRLFVRLLGDTETHPVGASVWGDTVIELADAGERAYVNFFTGEDINPENEADKTLLPLSKVLAHFPVASLISKVETAEKTPSTSPPS